ncbi:MAG TPA: NAD(P)H-hydrate dehydratase [Dehalococcoidales bacterium]|nr:NAD(P)H-hydrate dehydratase [Dehalococcoidales bacterium]
MKIVTAEQMREIDAACVRRGIPTSALMENAGKAVAEEARRFLGELQFHHVLCLVGGGNNGGDGLVTARYLRKWGADVTVYLCAARPANDANLKLVKKLGIDCIEAAADKGFKKFDALLAAATCVVDAILGTGKMRPLEGVFKTVLQKVSETKENRLALVVAVDLPSGLDANTGAIDPACPSADLTVTLAFPKPGLFLFPGAEKVGELVIADIGIPESLADSIKMELLSPGWARKALPTRILNSNKGTYGKVLVVAGSQNYIGAAYLACAGALRVGAGLVTLAISHDLQTYVASHLAEATYLPLPESGAAGAKIIARECGNCDVLLLGCGLGQSPAVIELVKSIIKIKDLPRLVVDADGLNILASLPSWWQKFPDNAVITPHPGEMARLSGMSVKKVQAERLGVAEKFATKWRKTVLLKGAFSVIASPDGRTRISPFANAGLATAGTGDVLAGAIAGFLAQGTDTFDAASLGVFVHGRAGENVKNDFGDAGMIASDLLQVLPAAIKQIKNRG